MTDFSTAAAESSDGSESSDGREPPAETVLETFAEPVAGPVAAAPVTAETVAEPVTAETVTEPVDLDGIERDLDDVQAALDRMNDGTYWTDEVTGEPIPDAVLAEHPTARTVSGTEAAAGPG